VEEQKGLTGAPLVNGDLDGSGSRAPRQALERIATFLDQQPQD
jgi:hypothetical protein